MQSLKTKKEFHPDKKLVVLVCSALEKFDIH